MKFRIFGMVIVLCMIVCCSSFLIPSATVNATENSAPSASQTKLPEGADANKVLEARFLNMLNHNFVYNEEFYTQDSIVNLSVLALLDLRDQNDSDYISANYVTNYIYSMYGISINDFSGINTDFPQKDGYVYIIPAGYTTYSHSMLSCDRNEDGSYTVVTEVAVNEHDGYEGVSYKAVSLFVRNPQSEFGYNLISSNILSDVNQI